MINYKRINPLVAVTHDAATANEYRIASSSNGSNPLAQHKLTYSTIKLCCIVQKKIKIICSSLREFLVQSYDSTAAHELHIVSFGMNGDSITYYNILNLIERKDRLIDIVIQVSEQQRENWKCLELFEECSVFCCGGYQAAESSEHSSFAGSYDAPSSGGWETTLI